VPSVTAPAFQYKPSEPKQQGYQLSNSVVNTHPTFQPKLQKNQQSLNFDAAEFKPSSASFTPSAPKV
jgi:hypothetical protein